MCAFVESTDTSELDSPWLQPSHCHQRPSRDSGHFLCGSQRQGTSKPFSCPTTRTPPYCPWPWAQGPLSPDSGPKVPRTPTRLTRCSPSVLRDFLTPVSLCAFILFPPSAAPFSSLPVFLPVSIKFRLPGPGDKGFFLREDSQSLLSPLNHWHVEF